MHEDILADAARLSDEALHARQPFGHQGPSTVDNISLRCRAHNVYESELVFGRFDPSIVREARESDAVLHATGRASGARQTRARARASSREIAPFRNGRSERNPDSDAVLAG